VSLNSSQFPLFSCATRVLVGPSISCRHPFILFFSFFLSFLNPLYFHISPSSSFSFDFVPNFFIFICFVLIHFSNFLFLFQLHPPLVFLFIKFGTHSFDLIFYFVDRIFYIKFCWYNGDDKMLPTKPKKIAFGIHMMPHTPPKNHDHFPHVDACSLCARFFLKKNLVHESIWTSQLSCYLILPEPKPFFFYLIPISLITFQFHLGFHPTRIQWRHGIERE
jgi:hypothetical protein